MEEVGLLVVVRGEEDEVDDSLQRRLQLLGIILHRLRVQHLPVVLAGLQVLVVVFRERDLLLVVPELQIRHIIVNRFIHLSHCPVRTHPFPLLLLLLRLLDLFDRLLRFPREVSGTDLPAQDLSLRPVAFLYAKRDLLEDEFGLLAAAHGAKGLDLEFAEDVGGGGDVALGAFDVGEDAGDAGALDFDKDLPMLCQHSR